MTALMFFAVIALIASLQQYHVNAMYTMSETCEYYSDGFVANPLNCRKYGYCQNNQLLGEAECPAGYSYNMYKATCSPSDSVICASYEETCKKQDSPMYLADQNDCNQYCYCVNSEIQGCAKCPTGQIFSSSINQCIWDDGSCPADSVCRLVPNGSIVADPSSCTNYILCMNGSGTSAQCPSSNPYYDPNTGYCQSDNTCNGGQSSSTSSPTTVCSAETDATTDAPTQIPDGTCYGYYVCTGQKAAAAHYNCPFATHYDPDLNKCVSPLSYACTNDRCGNLNLLFVAQSGTNCNTYAYCVNGTTQSTANCPADYPYYNEDAGICQIEKPSYPVCQ